MDTERHAMLARHYVKRTYLFFTVQDSCHEFEKFDYVLNVRYIICGEDAQVDLPATIWTVQQAILKRPPSELYK